MSTNDTNWPRLADLFAAMLSGDPRTLDRFGQWRADLPTYGGEAPADADGVWSWDERHVLVGTCPHDLTLAPRPEPVVRGHIRSRRDPRRFTGTPSISPARSTPGSPTTLCGAAVTDRDLPFRHAVADRADVDCCPACAMMADGRHEPEPEPEPDGGRWYATGIYPDENLEIRTSPREQAGELIATVHSRATIAEQERIGREIAALPELVALVREFAGPYAGPAERYSPIGKARALLAYIDADGE